MTQPQEQLVEQARQGCVDSFGKLYEQYYNGIVALAYSALGEMGLAEDAAQETFAIACKDFYKLKDNLKFASWLAGICRNISKQMLRNKGKFVNVLPADNVSNEQKSDETGDAVKKAVRLLNSKYREPIMLRYYDNLSYQQISEILGISQTAVNGRILRAKQKILKYMRLNGFTGADYGNE